MPDDTYRTTLSRQSESKTVIRAVLAFQLFSTTGFGLLIPVLPYFVMDLGGGPIAVTSLVAIYALMAALFSPMMGRLSDRTGRRRLLIGSATMLILSYVGMFFASDFMTVALFRAIGGIAAANGGVLSAILLDVSSEEQRPQVMGLFGSMNGFGMMAGPFLGAVLATLPIAGLPPAQIILASAALLSATLLVGSFFLPESHAPRKREAESEAKEPLRNMSHLRPNADLLTLNFGVFLGFSVVLSVSVLFMEQRFSWGISEAGLAIGLMTGMVAIGRAYFAPRCIKRWGAGNATALGVGGFGSLLLLCGFTTNPYVFVANYVAAALCYSIAGVAIAVLVSGRTTSENRGSVMGYLGSSGALAVVFGSLSNGFLFEYVSPSTPFYVGGLVGCGLAVWFRLARAGRKNA